jgi:hypothetical protein
MEVLDETLRSLSDPRRLRSPSVYFNDIWGHRLSVTTYEAEWVRR